MSLRPSVAITVLLTQLLLARQSAMAAIPRKAAYFPYQLVTHDTTNDINDFNLDEDGLVNNNNNNTFNLYYTQRFYSMGEHFGGPGSPIFLIFGGEGAIEPSTGILYPFIASDLAVSYQAFVLQPEHRFYGTSQPVSASDIERAKQNGDPDPRIVLLTPDQAIRDAIRLVRFVQDRLKCSRDRFSPLYCPVIAVGGSYSGFLAAVARSAYPYLFDMAYSSSPPMKFYAQQMETGDEYYQHITEQLNKAFPQCADAIQDMLSGVGKELEQPQAVVDASLIGACPHTIPAYINDTRTWMDEIVMMVGYTLANFNMAYYPPSSSHTDMGRMCQLMLLRNTQKDPFETLRQFFLLAFGSSEHEHEHHHEHCFNMSQQLPAGPHATISSGDWSGVGTGASGESWDFQTCTLCVERINMAGCLPRRNWTMEWLESHCRERFQVVPRPYDMMYEFGFDDMPAMSASHILFTNGLVDGWSVAGIKANLSETLVAMNFEHGAHHSDLSYYKGMHDDATEDIRHGRNHIRALFARWLSELPGGRISASRVEQSQQ